MLRAMIALTAGSTVLTPTSHGNIKFYALNVDILWENLFKYDGCHKL
jgi:hypothetical protein